MSGRLLIELKHELGLGPGATRRDVRKRFLELALRMHPDKTQDEKDRAKYMQMKEAYSQLMHLMPLERKQLIANGKLKIERHEKYHYDKKNSYKERQEAKAAQPKATRTETDQEKAEREMRLVRVNFCAISIVGLVIYKLMSSVSGD